MLEEMETSNQLPCYAQPRGMEYHFNLFEPIEGPEQFETLFRILRDATQEDLVYIHINCPGGCLNTTVQVVNAIRSAKCGVVGSAEGEIASGAAIIFFACDAYQVGEHCEFLIHTASGGHSGKITDTLSSATASVRRIESLYRDVFGRFLPEGQIDTVLRGGELYLDSEEVVTLLQEAEEAAETVEETQDEEEVGQIVS